MIKSVSKIYSFYLFTLYSSVLCFRILSIFMPISSIFSRRLWATPESFFSWRFSALIRQFLYHFDSFSVQFFFGILNPFFLSFFNWIQLALLVFTLLLGSFGFNFCSFHFWPRIYIVVLRIVFFMSRLLLPYSFWTFISLYSLEFLFPFLFGLSFPYSIWTFFSVSFSTRFQFFFNSFSILF